MLPDDNPTRVKVMVAQTVFAEETQMDRGKSWYTFLASSVGSYSRYAAALIVTEQSSGAVVVEALIEKHFGIYDEPPQARSSVSASLPDTDVKLH